MSMAHLGPDAQTEKVTPKATLIVIFTVTLVALVRVRLHTRSQGTEESAATSQGLWTCAQRSLSQEMSRHAVLPSTLFG